MSACKWIDNCLSYRPAKCHINCAHTSTALGFHALCNPYECVALNMSGDIELMISNTRLNLIGYTVMARKNNCWSFDFS